MSPYRESAAPIVTTRSWRHWPERVKRRAFVLLGRRVAIATAFFAWVFLDAATSDRMYTVDIWEALREGRRRYVQERNGYRPRQPVDSVYKRARRAGRPAPY